MKLFHKAKDGGPESNVTGYWLIECKWLFSIALLRFDKGSREAYHSHAFNAVSWILKGELQEVVLWDEDKPIKLTPSFKPIYTSRARCHRVFGIADKTWAITFRGPWWDKWLEYKAKSKTLTVLTHGRKEVEIIGNN